MRFISKKNEGATFPAIDPRHAFATWKASLTAPIEFNGLIPGKPVRILGGARLTGRAGQHTSRGV
ncbi:MAG TPA: hypothetical protein DEQ09_01725 [Bacteroidales bacterium]|nr:hypothetical protein [Bacteroidales bacterium]